MASNEIFYSSPGLSISSSQGAVEPVEIVQLSPDDANKRTDLLQRLNAKLASTRNLPPETLSLIFQFACPVINMSDIVKRYDSGNSRSPGTCHHLVYAAVSSYWRHVVWSTPELWTQLFLFIDSERNADEIQYLDLYLQNSGNLPLSLKVGCPQWLCTPEQLARGIIHKTAARLKLLILINFTDNTLTPLSTLAFPHLREFAIINDFGNKLSEIVINHAPLLHRFALRVVGDWPEDEPIRIPLFSMTSVDVGYILSRVAIRFLQDCPNLTEFSYGEGEGSEMGDENDDALEVETLVLPQLRSFLWTGYGGPRLDTLLDGLYVPNLQTLSINFFSVSNVHVWTDFFERLPKSLEILHLHEFPSTSQNENRFYPLNFLASYEIRFLALHSCQPGFVDGILEALAVYNAKKKAPVFLPSLDALLIEGQEDIIEETRGDVGDMVEQRYNNPCELPPIKLSVTYGRNFLGELAPEGILLELLN